MAQCMAFVSWKGLHSDLNVYASDVNKVGRVRDMPLYLMDPDMSGIPCPLKHDCRILVDASCLDMELHMILP